jgi:apolipoprotein N-acyltransferase
VIVTPIKSRYNRGMKLAFDLLRSLIIAFSFSAFIYLAHWDYQAPWLDTMLGLIAIWGLLTFSRRSVLMSGFAIGLLWFYWIGYSFTYYGLPWMVPFITLGFGLIYLLIFGTLALSTRPLARALILLGICWFEPFAFNWMKPELLFVNSYFGVAFWQFSLIVAGIALMATLKGKGRYLPLLLLLGSISYTTPTPPAMPLQIKLVSTDVPQALKWQSEHQEAQIQANIKAIDAAIAENYDVVVLPESVFPLFLNYTPWLMQTLAARSNHIAIVTGALLEVSNQNYNVTYFFNAGEVQIAKKMVLVPFGEYVPLPDFAREWVNQTFFDGASDYQHAEQPTNFIIRGITFRNAICYEATTAALFEDNPPFMLAQSNNAWFLPSIEPTLQHLLMQLYAKRHNTTIFHAANGMGTGIITP